MRHCAWTSSPLGLPGVLLRLSGRRQNCVPTLGRKNPRPTVVSELSKATPGSDSPGLLIHSPGLFPLDQIVSRKPGQQVASMLCDSSLSVIMGSLLRAFNPTRLYSQVPTSSEVSQKFISLCFLYSYLACIIPFLKNDRFTGQPSAMFSSHVVRANSHILVSNHPRNSETQVLSLAYNLQLLKWTECEHLRLCPAPASLQPAFIHSFIQQTTAFSQ